VLVEGSTDHGRNVVGCEHHRDLGGGEFEAGVYGVERDYYYNHQVLDVASHAVDE